MKSVGAKPARGRPARRAFAVAAVLLVVSALPLDAQQKQNVEQRPPTFNTGTPDTSRRAPSIREREFILRGMEREAKRPPTREEFELALEQIGEDFERMQVVNNELIGVAKTPGVPDYKLISEATSEIQRRASRLKNNMKLPKPEETATAPKYQSAEDVSQLKASLLWLDGKIRNFVQSPLFKNTDVVDAKLAVKASRDLAAIIELSQLINKDARRMNKSVQRP